jgi:hypothetical protein
MNWYVGLLEEIKCDLITIRLVEKFKPPFWQEIIEFVLLDRMFRYPIGSEKNLTFDGGTGILLFEILVQNGVLCTDKRERLHFKNELLVSQLEAIVAEIEALERLGDEQYKEAAMSYVQGHLGRPTEKFCRFNFSTTQYAMRVATR